MVTPCRCKGFFCGTPIARIRLGNNGKDIPLEHKHNEETTYPVPVQSLIIYKPIISGCCIIWRFCKGNIFHLHEYRQGEQL